MMSSGGFGIGYANESRDWNLYTIGMENMIENVQWNVCESDFVGVADGSPKQGWQSPDSIGPSCLSNANLQVKVHFTKTSST
jgi:hypothetical protein